MVLNNKKGIAFLYKLMLGTLIIILAIALAYPTKAPIDDSMSDMSCTSPANDWDQATCWFLDITKPFLVGLIIFIGFAVIFK